MMMIWSLLNVTVTDAQVISTRERRYGSGGMPRKRVWRATRQLQERLRNLHCSQRGPKIGVR